MKNFRVQGSGDRVQGLGFRAWGILLSLVLCLLSPVPGTLNPAYASPEMIGLVSGVVYRADGQGDYTFKGNGPTGAGKLDGVRIAPDGCVEYVKSPGTYGLAIPYKTKELISSITLNWEFEGEVTMQVSAGAEYVAAINGVPLEWGKFFSGTEIKWRATLSSGSRLSEVRITYTDISGTVGSFGNPALSGFKFRKPIYIRVQGSGDRVQGSGDRVQGSGDSLFHYQIPIKIGESAKAAGCDIYIKGILNADFKDVRFTPADAETSLPYCLEGISGKAPQRVATFWVKVPQIPKEGILIYLYYGKPSAEDLSSAEKTFDFFYDFDTQPFDAKKWKDYDFTKAGIIVEYKQGTGYRVQGTDGEIKTLDTAEFNNNEKIIEHFKAGEDYEWARARKAAVLMPAVDSAKTQAMSEELPNLPDFQGAGVAADGDLILTETKGQYTSAYIYPPFKARIMVPAWKADVPQGAKLGADISAKGDGKFKQDCVSDNYYYASKGDFSEGNTLRWRVRMSAGDISESGRVKEFSLDYRPGTITVISPDGKEKLAAGDTYKIAWSALEYEPSYPMKLEYSTDAGKTYNTITSKSLNNGSYLWTVPDKASTQALVRVCDGYLTSVNDRSNNYFSIQRTEDRGQMTEEEKTAEEIALELAKAKEAEEKEAAEKTEEKPGAGAYELLIKLGDNPSPGGYKEGDIVMVKPAGFVWGSEEKKKFLIIKASLSEEQAKRFMEPKELVKGYDKKGKEIKETLSRRRYKIDLRKQGSGDRIQGTGDEKPLINVTAIEEK